MAGTINVTVWSDVGCPWATLALHTLHDAAVRAGATLDVTHRCFPLELFNEVPTPKGLLDVEMAGIAGLVMRQFKNLGKGLDKLEYRLKGRLVTGNFGGYDFDQKGELDPAKLFRDGRPAKAPSEQF